VVTMGISLGAVGTAGVGVATQPVFHHSKLAPSKSASHRSSLVDSPGAGTCGTWVRQSRMSATARGSVCPG
jgi:hypothetical protein